MKRAYRRRYHYIYKTTCLVTGKYYLGMHSTDDLNDGYIGSGKRLWYSINKYGKENHVCEILEHYFTREWLREREAELVCAETLTDPLCMNLKVGGEGGFEHINELGLNRTNSLSPEAKEKARAGREKSEKWLATTVRFKDFGSNGGKASVEKYAALNEGKTLFSVLNKDSSFQEKRKNKFAEIGHQQGERNSQHGTCWIHSMEQKMCLKVKKDEVEHYLLSGWKVGRKMKF